MASTSVPQQGNLSTETINQLGTLDLEGSQLSQAQLGQLIRNLPSLLKVSYCPLMIRLVSSRQSTGAICEFGTCCRAIADGCVE